MNAQQRLSTALSGGIPDRVPVVPKIWVDLCARLTGTPLQDVISDPMTALQVIARAGELCCVDAIRQFHFPPRRIRINDERVFEVDDNGVIIGEIDMAGGLTTHLVDAGHMDITDPCFMGYHHYWAAAEPFVRDLADARRIVVPAAGFYVEQGCADRQRRIAETIGPQLTIIGDCSSATMGFMVAMRGMTRAVLDLIDQPKLVHAIMEKGVAIAVEKGKFNIDMGIGVLRLNDSVGNMNVMSPTHWREFVFPHMKAVCDALHAYDPQVRIYCHICGNILPIAEDLVETGLDCIGPLDPLGGFSPGEVRSRVGDAVSLIGGVNTMTFLDGTPEDIEAEAAACIAQAGVKGGYILGSGCVVPRNAAKENLLALRTASERYGTCAPGKSR